MASMTRSPAHRFVFGIARRVPSFRTPEYSSDIVSISGPVHTIVENIIFHESNPLATVYDIVSRLPVYYFQPLASPSLHVSGRGFTGTSCQSRDRVPLFTGFSLMQVSVTQPSPGYNSLGIGKFRDPGGDAQYLGSLYRDPVSSFSFCACFFLNPCHLEF